MTRFGRINLKYSTNLWRPAGLGRAQSQSQPFHSSSFIRVPSHASVSSLPLPGPRRDGSRAPVTALTIAGSDEPPSALLSIRSSMLALGPKGSVACLPACLLNQWVSFQMLLLAKLPASTHLATGSCEIVSCPAASVPVPENLCLGHGRLLPTAWRFRPATGFAVRTHMGSIPTFRFISCFCTMPVVRHVSWLVDTDT